MRRGTSISHNLVTIDLLLSKLFFFYFDTEMAIKLHWNYFYIFPTVSCYRSDNGFESLNWWNRNLHYKGSCRALVIHHKHGSWWSNLSFKWPKPKMSYHTQNRHAVQCSVEAPYTKGYRRKGSGAVHILRNTKIGNFWPPLPPIYRIWSKFWWTYRSAKHIANAWADPPPPSRGYVICVRPLSF